MADIWNCILVVVQIITVGAKFFRDDYTNDDKNKVWIKFNEIPSNAHEARLRCQFEGAVLASPTPLLKNIMMDFMQKQIVPLNDVFTGIHATFSPGDFSSVEGVPLARIPHIWVRGEPNNINDQENCIIMTRYGELADVSCNITKPYFCYKKYTDLQINECDTYDKEYILDKRTGRCYKFHRVPHIWSRAYMICEAEGGHLAIINSDVESEVLRDIFAKYPANSLLPGNYFRDGAMIGFRDIDKQGDWYTIHGQTLFEAGFDKFVPGQPDNNGGNQYCGEIYRSGLLDDVDCNTKAMFICEKNIESDVDDRISAN